jgi:hypothetical protein
MVRRITATQYEVSEWSYHSGKHYADPFNEIELDVTFTLENGKSWRVPAYWAGGDDWRVRFAPPQPGEFQVTTLCTDTANPDLQGVESTLSAAPYQGSDPLLMHGGLQVAAGGHTLEHTDGTPFFWLADTWWMGLCQRLKWPGEFQQLAADRAAKGFSVIQIVAGLYPDMPGFDPRGANEAGFPWETSYERINPAYFDLADLKIQWLVRSGLVPCIVSGWGYYLPILGIQKIKQHWRNIIARWGAYPAIWCLAGEELMPYYLSTTKDQDVEVQRSGWSEVGAYVRQIDPYRHLVTVHDHVLNDRVQDINMLQTGHGGTVSLSNTVKMVSEGRARKPAMPVLVGEVSYEGILHYSGAEVQRLTFWSSILSGAAGHTYGANGIWQVNMSHQPYGASPWGGTWGNIPWEDASHLPGSGQLGMARKFLTRYPWQKFEPHPDWVDPAGSPEQYEQPFAAGIPGEVRIIYLYEPIWGQSVGGQGKKVLGIEKDTTYQAFWWDPRTGQEFPLGIVKPDASGAWMIPMEPELFDWVLVLEKKAS